MENPVLGEWLVLFLLFLNCSRIFFLRYGKVDSLAFLAPISVIFSVLQIFAWGVDVFSFLILIISIFAFFTNFRALLRFSSGLFVDHYSMAFKIAAILILLLTIACAGLLFVFRPVLFKAVDFDAIQKTERLSGDFTNGFTKSLPFELAECELVKILPEKKENIKDQSIIIIPDKTADLIDYKILAFELAKNGYPVYMAEFFARDGKWCHNYADYKLFRRLYLLLNRFLEKQDFENQLQFYTFNIEKECQVMVDYVLTDQGENKKPVCLIGDWMSKIAIPEFALKNPEKVLLNFDLCDFEEYKTPGLGFVQYTAPVIAHNLGLNREKYISPVENIAKKIIGKFPVIEKNQEEEIKTEGDSIDAE
ncbi:MAG: hypothetical protein K6F15_06770 [Treponema sp.]|nr:hypothetical protein [Treponema sp.]